MIGRIVEVADNRRHLSMNRGFMVVRDTCYVRRSPRADCL